MGTLCIGMNKLKGVDGSGRVCFKALYQHFPRGIKENYEKIQYNQPPDEELNSGPPECETGVGLGIGHHTVTFGSR
jgi:hypothetical protein